MIYLDYSTNTRRTPLCLPGFCNTEAQFIGNPNLHHSAGREANTALS